MFTYIATLSSKVFCETFSFEAEADEVDAFGLVESDFERL
jgi:hypothetical protein